MLRSVLHDSNQSRTLSLLCELQEVGQPQHSGGSVTAYGYSWWSVVLVRYMSPWQPFAIRNALPQPDWVEEALLGTRQGDALALLGKEAGRPSGPRWEAWDSAKAKVVYHACLPSMLIKIVHDGLSRAVGLGAWAMKEVFWITAAGVYCVDRPETACNEPLVPASGGPAGRCGYSGTELITKDGTIPFKVVLRRMVDSSGLLWRKEELQNHMFCFTPDALHITHIHPAGQHPHTAWRGTSQASIVDITDYLMAMDEVNCGTPVGGAPCTFRAWAHRDREQ